MSPIFSLCVPHTVERRAKKRVLMGITGPDYPEKPGSAAQWGQGSQEIHYDRFMPSDNGKWIIIAFKT